MINIIRLCSVFMLVVCHIILVGQPSYNNGAGQGYVLAFSQATASSLYNGGDGQGYVHSTLINTQPTSYQGGSGDGYDKGGYEADELLYVGGNNDGYDFSESLGTSNFYYGGTDDGYASQADYELFYWTGAVGTGWNVTGNWNHSIIPDINRPVIIPEAVPNWPALNAGKFRIGRDIDQAATFRCGKIIIEQNAEMLARVNSFIENYDEFRIRGLLTVKNPVQGAFTNLSGGNLIIRPTGSLIFQQ